MPVTKYQWPLGCSGTPETTVDAMVGTTSKTIPATRLRLFPKSVEIKATVYATFAIE